VLSWAFEWHRPEKDLILTRGEPWFCARFEVEDPSRQVRLVEAEMTPELEQYLKGHGYGDPVCQPHLLAVPDRPFAAAAAAC